MASVFEVMAKLSGNSSGMVTAFKQATTAAESYRDRVKAATANAVDSTAAASKAKLAGSDTGNGFAGGFKGALAGIGVLAATVGFGAMVKEAGAASDSVDKFKATMNFAGLDTSAIDQATKAAKQFADQTVYDLPTIQNTIAQLASNGVKDYTGLTKAAGNLNAVAGGNAETFKSVAMTMTQTAGAGKLTTENWNQLANAIPGAAGPLMRALEEAGAYTGNFREAMEKGQISADEFNEALMKLGNDPVAVEAAKSTKTFEGAIGGLQATINSGLVGALGAIKPAATGAINAVSTGLGGAFSWLGKAATGLKDLFTRGDFTAAFREAFHVEEDSAAVDMLFKVRDAAMQLWAGLSMGSQVRAQFDGQLAGLVAFGAGARAVFDEVTGGTRAFFAAFKAGDGDITSSGFAGMLETLGMRARELADQVGPILTAAFAQIGPVMATLLPPLLQLVTAISPVGIAIGALTPVLPILAAAAGTLAAALAGALAGAFTVVVPLVTGIVTGVAEAVTWFMSLHGSAEALAAGIGVAVVGLTAYKVIVGTITAVTKAWAAIQAVLAAVMAVSPVTLIILGIAALIAMIVLLVMNWDTVVNTITVIWGGFVNWITGVMDGFVGWLGGIWNSIVAGVSAFASGLFTPVVDAWNAVMSFFGTIGAIIVGYVSGIVADVISGWNGMVGFITGIFNGIKDFITGVWTWIFNLLTAIGQAFWAEHGAQLTAAWNFIVAIFSAVLNFYISVWTNIINTVVGAATAIWNAIVSAFTTVYNFISSIMSAVWSFISGVWNGIVGAVSGAANAVWGVISSVFSAVWGFISSIFNTVRSFISGVWNNILGVITGVVNTIANAVRGGFNAAWSAVSSVMNQISGFISGMWNGIVGSVRGAVGQIGGVISGIYGSVVGALSGAGSWLIGAGRNIVQGLISGVQSLAGTIGNAFLSMVPGWIVGPFKAALGIASPSKLFKQFGRWIIQGLGNGVNSEEKTAVRAMDQAAAAVTAAGQGMVIEAPKILMPTVPDVASQLALPELIQTVRLNFVGASPLEAIQAMAREIAAKGPDGYLQGVDGGGYSPATLGARGATASQQAPEITVNVRARVTNPWTGEEVEAFVSEVATDVTAGAVSGTARVVRNSRSGGQEGF